MLRTGFGIPFPAALAQHRYLPVVAFASCSSTYEFQLFKLLYICITVRSGKQKKHWISFFHPVIFYFLISRCQVCSSWGVFRSDFRFTTAYIPILLAFLPVDNEPYLLPSSVTAAPPCMRWRSWCAAAACADPPFTKSQ